MWSGRRKKDAERSGTPVRPVLSTGLRDNLYGCDVRLPTRAFRSASRIRAVGAKAGCSSVEP